MRTTIRLDDALLGKAKAEAVRTGRTLTQVVEDALRESLARGGDQPRRRGRVEVPTFAGKGLQPGVDLDSSAGVLELMDDSAAG